MQIGSLDTGLDEEKIGYILNVAKLTAQQCMDCWAFMLCEQCIGLSLDGEKVSGAKRLSRCKTIQGNAGVKLRNLIFLLDHGVDFERFEEMQR